MRLDDLFRSAIALGTKADPRGEDGIATLLSKRAEKARKHTGTAALTFDEQDLWNPYADSRILSGTGEEDVQRLFVCIDLETPELLLMDRLRERGEQIDGFIAHHPEGRALGDLDDVMTVQIDILKNMGVPEQKAERLLKPRQKRLNRAIHALNLQRTPRVAELLGFPGFCCHNAADHLVAQHIYEQIAGEYDTIGEIVRRLEDVPEYTMAAEKGNPPMIACGSTENRPGKVALYGFNGGTSGPTEFIDCISEAGVGTILSMHISPDDQKRAEEKHLNVIQCSHMASDSLGMNLVLDHLLREFPSVDFVFGSGFYRYQRG